MRKVRRVLGIDFSTQTITAMLAGVVEEDLRPVELSISTELTESRLCRDDAGRRNPAAWVELARECISTLKSKAPEVEQVEAIGIGTTFPGSFGIGPDGAACSDFVSLYDNTDDAGMCGGEYDELLGEAELETVNRMWPGNMALGLIALLKNGASLDRLQKIVPPNTAFANELLRAAGHPVDPAHLFSDFTETAISGLYDARTGSPLPPGVRKLFSRALPEVSCDNLFSLLPVAQPSWRNVIPQEALQSVRELLGLPRLNAISIGAGDSPAGALALVSDRETVTNVRGSSDSPMIVVDSPNPRNGQRETVLHYPLPTATRMSDSPWCVVAPTLRSGRVWDWVRRLRFADGDSGADRQLEALALEALKSTRSRLGFDTSIGGERAPVWNPKAVGRIEGLTEPHGIGDIALAALVDMTQKLKACISLMECRYDVQTNRILLFGGPARNKLWNWLTQDGTAKPTFATTFADASLLGAALIGYGSAYDGREPDDAVSKRLTAASRLSSEHPLVSPVPVEPPK